MNKIKGKVQRAQTALDGYSRNHSKKSGKNPYQDRINIVESMVVVHPLIDRLIEIKMAKCLQHGQVYQTTKRLTHPPPFSSAFRTVEAPTISGESKRIERRSPVSRLRVDFTGVRKTSLSARPRTTNTIIRSRTSEPQIIRKLELFSRRKSLEEEEDEQLKPSFASNKARKNPSSATFAQIVE